MTLLLAVWEFRVPPVSRLQQYLEAESCGQIEQPYSLGFYLIVLQFSFLSCFSYIREVLTFAVDQSSRLQFSFNPQNGDLIFSKHTLETHEHNLISSHFLFKIPNLQNPWQSDTSLYLPNFILQDSPYKFVALAKAISEISLHINVLQVLTYFESL